MAKSAVPNIFTFGNLACGLMSIMMTLQSSGDNPTSFRLACFLIIAAGIMDRYDGRVARYLNVSSEIGKELDSLADLVSFGVAPSILIFTMYDFSKFGFIGYLLFLIFPLAGAYRLARYNCTTFDGVFTGIPITIAGMLVAIFSLFTITRTANVALVIVMLVILSYLMVSKLKIKKL